MRRRLSSQWTFFYKYAVTALGIGGLGLFTLIQFLAPGLIGTDHDSEKTKWLSLLVWIVVSPILYWGFARLKKVELDGDTLLISGFRGCIRVALRDIESVSGTLLQTPELVWLHFRRPTEFGTKIVFMGRIRWLSSQLEKHPVVREMRELVEAATDEKGEGPEIERPDRVSN